MHIEAVLLVTDVEKAVVSVFMELDMPDAHLVTAATDQIADLIRLRLCYDTQARDWCGLFVVGFGILL